MLMGAVVFGQNTLKSYADLMIEMEQNIGSKTFNKAWKKKRSDWEESVSTAQNIKGLEKLLKELVLGMNEATTSDAMDVEIGGKDLVSYGPFLMDFVAKLPSDLMEDSELELEVWKSKADEASKAEIQAREEMAKMEAAAIAKRAKNGFEKTFVALFEDAKKGSFANTIKGDKKEVNGKTVIDVSVAFSGGDGQMITVDGDNVYQYEVHFSAAGSESNGKSILNELATIIEKNLPEGFKKTQMGDTKMMGNSKFVFEFKAEKFAETAMRPSVTIGAYKSTGQVELIISEPVFKR